MQVILQGRLRHFRVAELLKFLSHPSDVRPARGTVDLELDGKRARVLYEGERLLWAEASDTSEPLDVLVSALDWKSGSFTVLDSAVIPENGSELGLSLDDVMAEAKRRRDELGPYADDAVFHVVEDPRLQQISLTPDEFRLLFRLAPGRSFRELLAENPIPRMELAGKLQRLENLGLIFVAADHDEAAASEPEPPAKQAMTAPPPPEPSPAPSRPPVGETAAYVTPSPSTPLPVSAVSPFAPTSAGIPKPTTDPSAEPTRPQQKTMMRKRTLVGSLTPDNDPETVYPLLDSELSIGRLADNSITLNDPSVSSHHARVLRTPEGFVLEDLQSRNGTFVNGEKVTGRRVLADGELIRFGRIVLLFNVAKESSATMTTQSEVPRQ